METMQSKIHPDELVTSSRGRVYLIWAVLVPLGFVATHYYQMPQANRFWLLISIVGLGYMYRVMPLRVKQMRNIFLSWLVPISVGMVVSVAAFRVSDLNFLIAYLGAFWLIVMAAGYFFNGLFDAPAGWYWLAAVLNALLGLLCFTVNEFIAGQYLIASIVTAWSMLNLWLFRT